MSRHLKRLAAPKGLRIPRKVAKWAVKVSPGPHPKEMAVPLLYIIRDHLALADRAREAKKIIKQRKVLIDGRVVTDHKFPVGIMDTVAIPEIEGYWRILIDTKGRLFPNPIPEENATWKLVRIDNKTTVKGGITQLNLNDGRNILVEEDVYRTGDVLKISVPDQEILEHIRFEPGVMALIIGGRHVGRIGHIKEYIVERSSAPNRVRFEEGFETIKENVFIIGRKRPLIELPEVRTVA